jgi:hypothetical protein
MRILTSWSVQFHSQQRQPRLYVLSVVRNEGTDMTAQLLERIEWEGCEQARLRRDGCIVIVRWFRSDPERRSRVVFKSGTPDYDFYKTRHQLNRAGSVSRIFQSWNRDKWIDIL